MHVAQTCVRFGAPGGAETHVAAISRELARRGHTVTVYTSDLYTEIPWVRGGAFDAPPKGVEVVRVGIEKDVYPFLRYPVMRDLDAKLLASDADLFHSHSHRYYQVPATARAARKLNRPHCITPHFHPPDESLPRWKHHAAWVSDRIERWRSYRDAARVFTVTDLEKQFVRHLARPRQLVTIPNGIHADEWRTPGDPKRFREWASLEGDYLLYTGRLAHNKGLRHLVEAFARIASRHPDVSLVLAGKDWGEGPALRALAEKRGVGARVRIPGFIPDQDLYSAAFAGCRAYALPSEWEAFGIVLLEAMACSKPVVATTVGGIPEVVRDGENGYLVPYADPGALADALDRLLSDPGRAAAMGASGRERALTHYDWSRIVDDLEREYETVLRA